MKNGIVIKSLLIGGTIITASLMMSEASATMNLAMRCKDNFVGQVTSVKASQTSLSNSQLAKVDVEFSVKDSDSSDTEKDSQFRSITVLRDGPHKYKVGQVYDVGLNQGFVCRMNRIEG